jgi:hypothetical protein
MRKFQKIDYYEYQQLVPALREYRKQMMQAMGTKPGEFYDRIYTEKRTFGARSKFYRINRTGVKETMSAYVAAHPTINVGGAVYNVDIRLVTGGGMYSFGTSYALYVNMVATTQKETICGALKTAVEETINNTINTQNMQNSENTNNAVNNGINIGTPTINTPYKQYNITIPVALPTGVTFEYKAVVENANPETFEVIDYEWFGNTSLAANGVVIAQTLNVLLGSDGYNALLKDLEVRANALAKCNESPVQPAVQPAAAATNDAVGQIDWIAVMRAFEEDFDLRATLIDAIGEVDCENAVDVEISSGYGRDFSVETSWDERSIADGMVDSVADSFYDWCKDQAAL